MPRNLNYRADLLDDLRDSAEFAAAYLSAAKTDSIEAFLVALRDVAEARKGMSAVAKETELNREHLYRALSKEGNPRLSTFDAVLDAVGMKYEIYPKNADVPPAAPPPGGYTFVTNACLGLTTITTPGGIVAQVPPNERRDYFTVFLTNQAADVLLTSNRTENSQLARAA